MVIAVAYVDVKHKETRKEKKGATIIATEFVGGRSTPDLPYAKLSEHSAGWNTSVHYHENDQFQVVVDGNCKLGRHDIRPYSVHFSRAYTPYGPLIPNKTGFTFFVLRTCYDMGARNMPESANTLKQVPNRKPWQISRQINMPKLAAETSAETVLQADPDIKDEQGLATYALSAKANANASGPDPSKGNGQFLLVLKGSVWHDSKELKAPTAIFVSPHEGAFQTRAGAEGMEALVLNFPRREQRSASSRAKVQTTNGLKTWQCTLCEFVYDEAAGLPDEGIAPGTRWADVPETWSCPDCSASKSDFQMVALELTATDQSGDKNGKGCIRGD